MVRVTFQEFVRRKDEGLWMDDGKTAAGHSLLVPDPRTSATVKKQCNQIRNTPGAAASACGPGPKPSWTKPIHRLKAF
jgi:hypothetical protein